MRWIVRLAVCALALVLHVTAARADQVKDLIDQLRNDSAERVRLSAALSLTKLGDARAIAPLASALGQDGSKDVRAAAAVGLGKLLAGGANSKYKGLVVAALKRATESDDSDGVKDQAQKALSAITGQTGSGSGSSGTGGSGGGSGGIYVNIGPMSAKTGSTNDKQYQTLMVTTATKTMAAKASGRMSTAWPGGAPSKAALAAKNVAGFYVDGTLDKLAVKTSGSGSTVTCKISMLLAEFPSKSMFGFLNGGATVTAGASQRDQDLAAQDCVTAVVEDLIAKKIIPTICTKAPCP
jgi:hypothetical protein